MRYQEVNEALGYLPEATRKRVEQQKAARLLDEILASRTYVRVLRTLALNEHGKLNYSGRQIARVADASHGRVAEILKELTRLGVVNEHPYPSYSIYELDEDHPLVRELRALFTEESWVARGWSREMRRRVFGQPDRT